MKQWPKVRVYKPEKVHFNQIVLALVSEIHINCPGDEEDISDINVRRNAATRFFERHCPEGALVEEVSPIKGRGKRTCAWRVRYKKNLNTSFRQINGEELARSIIKGHPNNTHILEKTRVMCPLFIEILYSIECNCHVSKTASRSIKRCDSVINVKVEENLANLKLEVNLQE